MNRTSALMSIDTRYAPCIKLINLGDGKVLYLTHRTGTISAHECARLNPTHKRSQRCHVLEMQATTL